jgi:hypothetical protein
MARTVVASEAKEQHKETKGTKVHKGRNPEIFPEE